MPNNFIALDVETAQGKRWSICQIGLTIVENGILKETITMLVQPPNNEYFGMNISIHGIHPSQTANEPFFPEIWERIYPLLANKKLVAHNASFDKSCLNQALKYYNLDVPEFNFDCTYKRTKKKLNIACDYYGISLKNHHDAGFDAEACAKIYLKLLEEN